MADLNIDEYLVIDTKAVLKRQLIRSYVRTAIGFGVLVAVGYFISIAFETSNIGASFMAFIMAIFAFIVLAGFTPRFLSIILHPRGLTQYSPKSAIHDRSAIRARVAAAHAAIKSGANLGPDVFRMRRRLKILLICRLLGAVAILMVWVALRWYQDHAYHTAHFERFGTDQAVTVVVDLEGNETVTIDPNSTPGSVRTHYEQPPFTQPASPAQAEPAPLNDAAPETVPDVSRTPVVPPNPALPSYWPAITEGYSVKIYERTPSGQLWLVEIRVQYGDGTMYAVGP